jgi:hypothetical protein
LSFDATSQMLFRDALSLPSHPRRESSGNGANVMARRPLHPESLQSIELRHFPDSPAAPRRE